MLLGLTIIMPDRDPGKRERIEVKVKEKADSAVFRSEMGVLPYELESRGARREGTDRERIRHGRSR